jgi:carboxyl-terminal processing protease
MAGALARFVVSKKSLLGTMSMRGQELQFNAEPVVVTSRGERLEPFKGPLALVIDETSASTSEVFAGGLRAIGRARTFGSPSAGMALPAAMSRLPSGDVLLHAIADYLNSDGTRLEGDGVPTDESVPVRREDLLAGVDAPLREAARWIVNETAGASGAATANNAVEE